MKRSFKSAKSEPKRIRTAVPIPKWETPRIDVLMTGTGQLCELGLGPRVLEVKRPRLNPFLKQLDRGVSSFAVGGAHVIAIDQDGKLLSWGQNDSGALGRNTVLPTVTEDDSEEEDDINRLESTPAPVEGLSPSISFVSAAATDNLSAAITTDGRLWAWGTFIDDGTKMFQPGIKYQRLPWLCRSLKDLNSVAGGADHLLCLNSKGQVYTWGTGAVNQLGVTVNPNLRSKVFGPIRVPKLKDIEYIAAGEYQSFAINRDGVVYSWGLNNFAQAGHGNEAGEGAKILSPQAVDLPEPIKQVASGNHHTLFLSRSGTIYTIGETNLHQLGVAYKDLPEQSLVREPLTGDPAYVTDFIKLVKGREGDDEVDLPKFTWVAAGTNHSVAIDESGSAWTWGYGDVYQLGHGSEPGGDGPSDEVIPRKIENTATKNIKLTIAGAGGQTTVLGGTPIES